MLSLKIPDLLKQDSNGFTGLINAVEGNNFQKLRMILNDASGLNVLIELIDKTDIGGRSALWKSCFYGFNNIAQYLISRKADINLPNENGASPLYVASEKGHTTTVQLLLANNARVDQAANDGVTPLWIACQEGHIDVVKLLHQHGADLMKAEEEGQTPIYSASRNGHPQIVEFLLNDGVSLNHHSYNNWTILHGAAMSNHHAVVVTVLNQRNKEEVINDNKNEWNVTPLTLAIQEDGDINLIKMLVQNGADVNMKGNRKTPLEWARDKGKADVAQYLKENGAKDR